MDDALNMILGRGLVPLGHCMAWEPWLMTAHAGGDVALAFCCAVVALAFRKQARPVTALLALIAVLLSVDAAVVWRPLFALEAASRLAALAAALCAAVTLPRLVPHWTRAMKGARKARERGLELEAALEELEHLVDKTRDLDQLKSRFFESVSHELRAPLAMIIGPGERLARDAHLNDVERQNVDVILRNARLLMKHVDDIIDVSRLDAGRLEPEVQDVDVAALMRQVCMHFESVGLERDTRVLLEAPDKLRAELDGNKFQRVLLNLLSNAFKFTGPSGLVRCTLKATPGERLVVVVADSGPGVPADQRDKIFERFAAEGDGTGLGLAIARELVLLHGGTIHVEDAPEGGAQFVVELPRWAPSTMKRAPSGLDGSMAVDTAVRHAVDELRTRMAPAVTVHAHEGPLVLIVEDDEDAARAAADALHGFRTERAHNGRLGFDLALTLAPDVIVTDFAMPEMNGEELLRRLRAHPDLARVPVLLMASKSDDETRVRLLQNGAQDWVPKPFAPQELRARVKMLASLKRTHDVLQGEVESPIGDLEALAREVTLRKRSLAKLTTNPNLTRPPGL